VWRESCEDVLILILCPFFRAAFSFLNALGKIPMSTGFATQNAVAIYTELRWKNIKKSGDAGVSCLGAAILKFLSN
jgi:hypothetical protein